MELSPETTAQAEEYRRLLEAYTGLSTTLEQAIQAALAEAIDSTPVGAPE